MDATQKQTCLAIVNIFESGHPLGNYGAVGGLTNDKGHLSYGKSQVSLMSRNLYFLIKAYCDAPDAQFAEALRPYLARLMGMDITLDRDGNIQAILRQAGGDPAMHRVQDDYFDRNFYLPAIKAATQVGLEQPLSQTIAYDTHIQGGWQTCSGIVMKELGKAGGGTSEEAWIRKYLEVRTGYLQQKAAATLYRPEAFLNLVTLGAWTLNLPVTVRKQTITSGIFGEPASEPLTPTPPISDPERDSLPMIIPQIPYMRGPGVLSVQKILNTAGLTNSEDQIYGPFTQTLVRTFQTRKELKPDAVVGPNTWAALGTSQPANP